MDRTSDTAPPFHPGPTDRHPSSTTAPAAGGAEHVPADFRTPVYAGLIDDWTAAGREPPFPVSSFPVCGTCRLLHPPAPDAVPPPEAPDPGWAPIGRHSGG